MPLHRLWGHCQAEVKAYGSGVWRGMTREGMIEKAVRFKNQGFSAIKMQIGHVWGDKDDVENVRRVREAVGDDVDIMVDANMAYTADHAILMGKRIEEYDVYWLEEPVVPDDFEGYFRVASALKTRVVGGESHFTRFDLKPFFQNPGLPDPAAGRDPRRPDRPAQDRSDRRDLWPEDRPAPLSGTDDPADGLDPETARSLRTWASWPTSGSTGRPR